MRLLGIDFGSKRIGVAVGVFEERIASPRKPLKPSGTLNKDADAISELAKSEDVDVIVVGIPENETDDRMKRICQRLCAELRSLGWTVDEIDEALTSVEAHARLASTGIKAAKRRTMVDGEASCRILERYFAQT